MRRTPKTPAKKGSQKWIQEVVNNNPDILDAKIKKQLGMPEPEIIAWLSPLASDGYAEYQDQSFLDQLSVDLPKVPLSDFWPKRGPVWDAFGKSSAGDIFIVEAKSHILEAVSGGTGAGEKSLEQIVSSLSEVKAYVGTKTDVDWSQTFYQYTNRLAHLYLLRVLNNIPAYLVFVYFVNDNEMNGPKSIDEWTGAIKWKTVF